MSNLVELLRQAENDVVAALSRHADFCRAIADAIESGEASPSEAAQALRAASDAMSAFLAGCRK